MGEGRGRMMRGRRDAAPSRRLHAERQLRLGPGGGCRISGGDIHILGTGIGVVTTLSSKQSIIRRKREMLTVRARAKLGDPRAQAEIEANPRVFRYRPESSRDARRERRREIRRRTGES